MNESKYQSLIIAQQKIYRYKNNIYLYIYIIHLKLGRK